jgi:AbrB family looped-hinge helix DNA binding protein
MGFEIKLSSKGQIVIPKDVRDALGLAPGDTLMLSCRGREIVLETPAPPREKISYEEFRRRVPRYEGPPVAVEDMTSRIGELFRDWKD